METHTCKQVWQAAAAAAAAVRVTQRCLKSHVSFAAPTFHGRRGDDVLGRRTVEDSGAAERCADCTQNLDLCHV